LSFNRESENIVYGITKFAMNGEADSIKNLRTGKGDVKLGANKEKLHKNGVKNGVSSPRSSDFEQTPISIAVMTYIAYAILILFGYLRDFMRFYGLEKSRAVKERGNKVSSGFLTIYF
jgi:hypothetical protein